MAALVLAGKYTLGEDVFFSSAHDTEDTDDEAEYEDEA